MQTVIEHLAAHLEQRYGIDVAGLVPLEPWAPHGVQRVDRRDGPAWVARVFPANRPVERTEGDAEVLQFLERHDYPAERCAHSEPVSTLDGHAVLVTTCAPGDNARSDGDPQMLRTVGDLLGRLHTLPEAGGAVAREAGCWHQLSVHGGNRQQDVKALLELMEQRSRHLSSKQLASYELVCEELQRIDDCSDLPKALINVDFAGPNLVKSPDGPVLVDWTDAGRGPRILSMNMLMLGARDLGLVDAFVSGYRQHVRLTDEELDRLAGALPGFSFILDCLMFTWGRSTPEDVLRELRETREQADRIAARVREAFDAPA